MGYDDVAALADLRGIRADGAAHRLAELVAEVAQLRRENAELQQVVTLAVGSADAVVQRWQRLLSEGSSA